MTGLVREVVPLIPDHICRFRYRKQVRDAESVTDRLLPVVLPPLIKLNLRSLKSLDGVFLGETHYCIKTRTHLCGTVLRAKAGFFGPLLNPKGTLANPDTARRRRGRRSKNIHCCHKSCTIQNQTEKHFRSPSAHHFLPQKTSLISPYLPDASPFVPFPLKSRL